MTIGGGSFTLQWQKKKKKKNSFKKIERMAEPPPMAIG
jgi:hypothetical protein